MSRDRSPELDIEAELESDPRVGANHLGVSVNHRAVALSGVASSYSEKWAAPQDLTPERVSRRTRSLGGRAAWAAK